MTYMKVWYGWGAYVDTWPAPPYTWPVSPLLWGRWQGAEKGGSDVRLNPGFLRKNFPGKILRKKRSQLIIKIKQTRLMKTKEEIEKEVEDFFNKYEENLNEKEQRSLHYMGSVIKCSESDLIDLMTKFAEKISKDYINSLNKQL